jgi:hypothetical protein
MLKAQHTHFSHLAVYIWLVYDAILSSRICRRAIVENQLAILSALICLSRICRRAFVYRAFVGEPFNLTVARQKVNKSK